MPGPYGHSVTTLGEVTIRMHHGVRGHDALIVHGIRHRRWVGPIPDQYRGLQGDASREYVTLTRWKMWTIMWMGREPHGRPGKPSPDRPFPTP